MKKEVRKKFRTDVFTRDGNHCKCCPSKSTDLDAHHITDRNDMPFGGYVLENGITLCKECHIKSEKYHQTEGREFVIGYHPDDLYKLINSSKGKSVVKSQQLKVT
jgi:5-methylcytosine-specific restriction endonuclease McrA